MRPRIQSFYGDKIRVRVCGLCWRDGRILMVNHRGLADGGFWAPPGGGLEFGESVHERLVKEFVEETGFQISVGKFQFGCEFIQSPLHAIELFFQVSIKGGELKKGQDPEMPIISDVRFMSEQELKQIPRQHLHGIFRQIAKAEDLKSIDGFFTI
jgi:8-oxo-dGTP diphosphatase